MNEAKLKACPFCKGEAAYIGTRKTGWKITCTWPACMVQLNWSYRLKTDAKRQWNTRAGDREPEANPNAGLTIAICHLEADAALMVAMWNWARTVTPNAKLRQDAPANQKA